MARSLQIALYKILPHLSLPSFKMLTRELQKLLQMVCGEATAPSSSCLIPFALQAVTLHSFITMMHNGFFLCLYIEEKKWLHVTVASVSPWMFLTDGIHFEIKTDQSRPINLVPSSVYGGEFRGSGDVRWNSGDHHEGYNSFTRQDINATSHVLSNLVWCCPRRAVVSQQSIWHQPCLETYQMPLQTHMWAADSSSRTLFYHELKFFLGFIACNRILDIYRHLHGDMETFKVS